MRFAFACGGGTVSITHPRVTSLYGRHLALLTDVRLLQAARIGGVLKARPRLTTARLRVAARG